MFYRAFKELVAIGFNILNLLLGGNLPPFGCVCIVVERNGYFLVLRRPQGRIIFPGGFMRWREHPEQTVQREGLEETGLQLQPVRIIGYFPIVSPDMRRMSTLNLAYQAEVASGELQASIEGQPHWLPIEELHSRLTGIYRDIFLEYLRQQEQST